MRCALVSINETHCLIKLKNRERSQRIDIMFLKRLIAAQFENQAASFNSDKSLLWKIVMTKRSH